jgi:hypothetical protein
VHVNSILEWTKAPGGPVSNGIIEIGAGKIYNSAWGASVQVINLCNLYFYEITQVVTFDSTSR